MVSMPSPAFAVVVAVAAALLLLGENVRLPPYETLVAQQHTASLGYDLKDLHAPQLSGLLLQFFAGVMRVPVLARVVSKLMYRDLDMLEVRRLAASLPDKPLFQPLVNPVARADLTETTTTAPWTTEQFTAFSDGDGQGKADRATGEAFTHWTVHDYTTRYATQALSPMQVARAFIAAVEDSENRELPMRIFIAKNDEDILRQARASAARYASGSPLGALDGVLVAVKDELAVQGYATTVGTAFIGGEPEHADAIAVARLRQAGAIIVGKTNLHEIGCGITGHNQFHGTPRNPYDPTHHTGGSSSGSAAAVASGMVPLAVGVDGGGSIRIPAGLCGVVGIKPTFGRIPPAIASVASIGPMAGNVRDTALAYAIMGGGDIHWPSSLVQPQVTLKAFDEIDSLKGLKIGYFNSYTNHSSPVISSVVHQSLQQLQARGAELIETPLEHLLAIHLAHSMTITSEIAEIFDKLRSRTSELAEETQILLNFAHEYSAVDFLAAQRVRAFAIRQLQENVYGHVDVFVSPTTGATAPKIPVSADNRGVLNTQQTSTIFRFSWYGNFAGTPGIAVPVGYDGGGLPISLQIQSNHWNEDVMLRVAHAVEAMSVTAQQKPKVYYSIIDEAAKFAKE